MMAGTDFVVFLGLHNSSTSAITKEMKPLLGEQWHSRRAAKANKSMRQGRHQREFVAVFSGGDDEFRSDCHWDRSFADFVLVGRSVSPVGRTSRPECIGLAIAGRMLGRRT